MTKIFQTLWRKKFIIITLAILVAMLPHALTAEASVLSKTIVTAIGIDKVNGEYEIITESIIFNFDPFGVPERELDVAHAPTIEQALAEIGMNKGRKISFSHTTLILLGKGLADEDLTLLLHPFLVMPQLNNGAVLMWTQDPLEDTLQASIDTGDVRSAKLQQIAEFNKRKTHERIATSLEQFFRGSLGTEGVAKLNIIELEDKELINGDRVAMFYRGVHRS